MKFSLVRLFLILVLSIVLQSSVVNRLMPRGFVPDFLLIVVLLASLRMDSVPSLFLAFFSGLLQDFTSGKYIGPHAAGSLVAVYFLLIVSRQIYADRYGSLALVCFLGVIVKQLVSLGVVLSFLGFDSVNIGSSILAILSVALISAIIAPVVSHLFFKSKIKR